VCHITSTKTLDKPFTSLFDKHLSLGQAAHLVDGNPVSIVHLVKLVDAHDAAISQHHSSGFQPLLTCNAETDSPIIITCCNSMDTNQATRPAMQLLSIYRGNTILCLCDSQVPSRIATSRSHKNEVKRSQAGL